MSVLSNSPKRPKIMQSILFTSTLIVAVCILMVVATTEYIATKRVEQVIFDGLQARARETTGLISTQMSASVNFNNRGEISTMMDAVIRESGGDAVGGLVVNRKGTHLYESASETINIEMALGLAEQVLESGENAASSDGMLQAIPVRFGLAVGPEMGIVGVALTQWSSVRLQAQAQTERAAAVKLSGAVFLAALLAAAVALRGYIAKPIEEVSLAMARIADEEFETVIPNIGRFDEIGRISRRLLEFRDSLASAQSETLDNAFRGAGFRRASASMMLIDQDNCIRFANLSCRRLLTLLTEEIREQWPEFDVKEVLGNSFANFEGVKLLIESLGSADTDLPITTHVHWGKREVRLVIDRVVNAEEGAIGFAIEWADVTEQNRNAAVLEAINNNQIRLDLGTDWTVLTCNQKFSNAFGSIDIVGKQFKDIFRPLDDSDVALADIQSKIVGGESSFGRFWLRAEGEEKPMIEGVLSPVLNMLGQFERAVFLGVDITEAHQELEHAQQLRAVATETQKNVVEALEIGLKKLASGDLTAQIMETFPGEYEKLRIDYNWAVDSLAGAMGVVVENAGNIRLETQEITSAADDLAVRTEKQASTLGETAAALEQLTSSVLMATESADQVSEMATGAQKNAELGGDVSLQANVAMDEIRKSSQEISKITGVIDEIAFQTNLLALNAGVEAARAGDAGRGFAVVATEVRALAQRSSDAASEINALISASGRQVKSGVELVNQTSTALNEIVGSAAIISTRIREIAVSNREQSIALGEINTGINDLDQVTQQNAAMFEQTTAASHALMNEADALLIASEKFQLDGLQGAGQKGNVIEAKSQDLPGDIKNQMHGEPQPKTRMVANAVPSGASPPHKVDSWEEF